MARKVKETPILSGKDSERFECAIKSNAKKKVDRSDYDRAKAIYDRVNPFSTFA